MSTSLGRPLIKGEIVHHKDENKRNNLLSNLVLFKSIAEHNLHHAKERAFEACGNYSFMRCKYCKEYDDPINMSVSRLQYAAWHKPCAAIASKEQYTKHRKK